MKPIHLFIAFFVFLFSCNIKPNENTIPKNQKLLKYTSQIQMTENKDSVFKKINKFVKVIEENDLFSTSVFKCTTTGMDKQRKLTLMFIRLHIYFMLPVIGWLKQYYLKRGKYNY